MMDDLFVEPDDNNEIPSEADQRRRETESLIKRLRWRIAHAESASLAIIKPSQKPYKSKSTTPANAI